MEEKDVYGFEKYYTVCTNGDIFSKERIVKNNGGEVIKKRKKCSPINNGNGYFQVSMFNGKKWVKRYIHRLVAETFLGFREGMEINHIDGNKSNNDVSNLEWVTHRENMIHAVKNKLLIPTTKKERKINNCKNCGKETVNKVCCSHVCLYEYKRKNYPKKEELKDMIDMFKSYTYVGKMYSVSDNTVKKWCKFYEIRS